MLIRRMTVLFLTVLFFAAFQTTSNAVFFGDVKTGLQNVASDRYGYSIFVPSEYTPDKKWPLVMALHDEGKRGEDYIQSWVETAKNHGVIVFCPTYEHPRSGLPYEHDKRLIGLQEDIQNQYEIDPNRILITGSGAGGHYAFYLGLQFSQKFTAIASIGNGFTGILQKLFKYSYAETNQLPILMLLKPEDKIESPEMSAQLNEIKKRGYLLEVVEVGQAKDLESPNTNSYVLEWFSHLSAQRETGSQERSHGVKQSIYGWVDNVLQNR